MKGLVKQRFRWAFGTLQCLWKHGQVTLRPRFGALGLIAVPQTWLFQFLHAVVALLVDLALIWRLAASSMRPLQHQDQYDPGSLQKVGAYYLAFLVIDLGSAALALLMEGREKWQLMYWWC
jgi:peptidoglycan-N-acetylglucosamine deacetylase